MRLRVWLPVTAPIVVGWGKLGERGRGLRDRQVVAGGLAAWLDDVGCRGKKRGAHQRDGISPPRGRLAKGRGWVGPLGREVRHPAVGVIAILSFLASSGSGTVTSTTPSRVFAVILFASTPAGSAIERENAPQRRSCRT
jgi:hypothetical protein